MKRLLSAIFGTRRSTAPIATRTRLGLEALDTRELPALLTLNAVAPVGAVATAPPAVTPAVSAVSSTGRTAAATPLAYSPIDAAAGIRYDASSGVVTIRGRTTADLANVVYTNRTKASMNVTLNGQWRAFTIADASGWWGTT